MKQSCFYFMFLIIFCSACSRDMRRTPQNVNLIDDETLFENIVVELDAFVKERALNTVIVFRLKDYDCGECKRYFIDLYVSTRKKTDQIVLLSRFPTYRSVLIFKKQTGIEDPIINFSGSIAKFDQALNPYVFTYRGEGVASNFFEPLKTDLYRVHNEQVLDSMINHVQSINEKGG